MSLDEKGAAPGKAGGLGKDREDGNRTRSTFHNTRSRQVELVDADLVTGPGDQCRSCGQPGSYEVDHWQVCPTRIDRLKNELAEVLAGGGTDG